MDDPRLTRRKLIASSAIALSAATAGCSLDAPAREADDDGTAEDEGFPEEFERPEDLDEPPAQSGLTEVYREVVDSVAAVRIEDELGTGGGTGWIYEDDYLVTNEHIARFTDEPFLWFRGEGWREGTIVGMDHYSDLAVIEVEGRPEDATPLPLVDAVPAVGTPVAAIGNPFNLTGSFTTGVISGRERTIDFPGREFTIADGIQTDAAVNPGNSGGPLVTFDGEVAGVISAGQGENIGFAISAALTSRVIPALIEDGNYDHTYLGVWLRDVTPDIIETNDLGPYTWGVYIDQVLGGGPSDGALQGSRTTTIVRDREVPIGGDVIVEMDDRPIMNREDLSAFLALETSPGQTIDIDVIRDGERRSVEVELGLRPDPDEDEGF